jgi:hypothetical protein
VESQLETKLSEPGFLGLMGLIGDEDVGFDFNSVLIMDFRIFFINPRKQSILLSHN